MHVWRICKRRRVPEAFEGFGAERHGGRWNHKGHRIVYTSSSLSLASLELFVHLQPNCIPDDLYSMVAKFPEAVSSEILTVADLPKDWRDFPAPASLQDIGSQWLRENRSLLLVVPSAVNPDENNVLINPLHLEINELTDVKSKPFHFDPRMWKTAK